MRSRRDSAAPGRCSLRPLGGRARRPHPLESTDERRDGRRSTPCRHRVASEFVRGGWTFIHGETQAGTPGCPAAIVARHRGAAPHRRGIGDHVTGRRVSQLTTRLVSDGIVTGVTGRGCFLGLELCDQDGNPLSGPEVLRVVSAVAANGVLVQPGPSSIELIPAYGFTPGNSWKWIRRCVRVWRSHGRPPHE